MGFCQFGCDFPNIRNLSKTFLRYSRKVVSGFVRSPCFLLGYGGDIKNLAENQWNSCTIVHGFLSIWLRFSEFSKLVQNVLRYSRKALSSFVRSPCFLSDWQWFLKYGWKSMKSMYYSTWVFVNLVVIFRIFETSPKCSLGTPEKLWVVSLEAHVSFQDVVIFKIWLKINEIHVL